MAHALHGEAGQALASVHLALGPLESELTPAGRRHLAAVHQRLGEVEGHLRRLAHELRPPALDDVGLVEALQLLGEGVSLRAGLTVAIEGALDAQLPPAIETAIYRIVQEALTNVTRHARASHVRVRLWCDGASLHCTIRDNGAGFDLRAVLARRGSERGLGLMGIQERVAAFGGRLRIDSTVGEGSAVDVAIPLEVSDGPRDPAGR
jgi:signal transduction histidine kinase